MEQTRQKDPSVAVLLLKLIFFLALISGTVLVWFPLFILFPAVRHSPVVWNAASITGAILIDIGAAVVLWCGLAFAIIGKGTPAIIEPPRVLVARGLYRYARNPMYLAVFAILAGESLLFWSAHLAGYAVVVVIGFNLFVRLYEEPNLKKRIGPAYVEYCRSVPRWIPKPPTKRPSDAL